MEVLYSRSAVVQPRAQLALKFTIIYRMQWPARVLEFAPLLYPSVTIKMRAPATLGPWIKTDVICRYVQYTVQYPLLL
jgi:hypothetical protein